MQTVHSADWTLVTCEVTETLEVPPGWKGPKTRNPAHVTVQGNYSPAVHGIHSPSPIPLHFLHKTWWGAFFLSKSGYILPLGCSGGCWQWAQTNVCAFKGEGGPLHCAERLALCLTIGSCIKPQCPPHNAPQYEKFLFRGRATNLLPEMHFGSAFLEALTSHSLKHPSLVSVIFPWWLHLVKGYLISLPKWLIWAGKKNVSN